MTSLAVLAVITAASSIIAQADVGLGEAAALIRDLGALGVLLLILWLWMAGRLVRGADFTRVLTERNESQERERAMHQRVEDDVIPAVTEMSRLVTRMLDGERGPGR